MGLSLENQSYVWQKVAKALVGASPAAQAAFFELRKYLSQQKKPNVTLQFIPFTNATGADPGICQNTGYSPIGVAARVYAIYAKNDGTGDGTDSFIALHNAADNASAALFAAVIQDDNDEFYAVKHDGWAFGTDVTISGATTIGGATESAAANAANGFIIVGAA